MEHNGEPYFFSLDFNLAGQALPPISPKTVVAEQPRTSWGIIAFDVFVMNSDRHTKNMAYDTTTKKLQIFDHSHALFGPAGVIPDRLNANKGQMAIGGHCLAPEINAYDGLDFWVDRIAKIPDYFLEDIIDAATNVGFPEDQKQTVKDFFKERRDNIKSIITANKGSFPLLPKGAV